MYLNQFEDGRRAYWDKTEIKPHSYSVLQQERSASPLGPTPIVQSLFAMLAIKFEGGYFTFIDAENDTPSSSVEQRKANIGKFLVWNTLNLFERCSNLR